MELKKVYNFIDKRTETMWSHKNISELVHRGNKDKTRHAISKNKEDMEEEKNWEKNTKAQFGYGEITKVSSFG